MASPLISSPQFSGAACKYGGRLNSRSLSVAQLRTRTSAETQLRAGTLTRAIFGQDDEAGCLDLLSGGSITAVIGAVLR